MLQVEHQYNQTVAAIHRLRINVKSLAAESKLIRHEERRCGTVYRNMLSLHRRGRLREESRYAQLALAFLRARPYRNVEQSCRENPDCKRLMEKLNRYLPAKEHDIAEWLK